MAAAGLSNQQTVIRNISAGDRHDVLEAERAHSSTNPKGCWLHPGAGNGKDYYQATIPIGIVRTIWQGLHIGVVPKQVKVSLHILACFEGQGEPDDNEMEAHHMCHFTRCFNPAHMEWKTKMEHQQVNCPQDPNISCPVDGTIINVCARRQSMMIAGHHGGNHCI